MVNMEVKYDKDGNMWALQEGRGGKKVWKKIGKALRKAGRYAKKKKLLSRGLNALSDVVPDPTLKMALKASSKGARQAGYGHCNKRGKGLKRAGEGIRTAGGGRGANAWIKHCKCYHAKHPNLTWKQVLQKAKASYKK
jgi:hypothetical protein